MESWEREWHGAESIRISLFIYSIKPDEIDVLVGTNSLRLGGSIYGVTETIRHEKFNARVSAYDIGLIRVDSPIEFDDRVQPIIFSSTFISANVHMDVFGWGRLKVDFPFIYRRSFVANNQKTNE